MHQTSSSIIIISSSTIIHRPPSINHDILFTILKASSIYPSHIIHQSPLVRESSSLTLSTRRIEQAPTLTLSRSQSDAIRQWLAPVPLSRTVSTIFSNIWQASAASSSVIVTNQPSSTIHCPQLPLPRICLQRQAGRASGRCPRSCNGCPSTGQSVLPVVTT